MTLTCEVCEKPFEKASKTGPIPKYCSDVCRQSRRRVRKEKEEKQRHAQRPDGKPLTLRDVINVAELPLTAKQCDVVIDAFTKARNRAMKKEKS